MIADKRYHHLEHARSALSTLIYPLQYVANLPMSLSDWITETFAERSRLIEENRALHKSNLLLQVRQQKFAALEAENERMRAAGHERRANLREERDEARKRIAALEAALENARFTLIGPAGLLAERARETVQILERALRGEGE